MPPTRHSGLERPNAMHERMLIGEVSAT